MALMPKRTKHRKQQKGSCAGLAKGGCFVEFGEFGMQSLGRGWITAQQIEACRVTITRYFSRKGKVWIRFFPDKPISKKPAETRMGKGKDFSICLICSLTPASPLPQTARCSVQPVAISTKSTEFTYIPRTVSPQ